MAFIDDILVSAFVNVREKKHPEHLPLIEILENIKNGSDTIDDALKIIRDESDPARKNILKVQLLPVFCCGGTFRTQRDSDLITFSKSVCLDLDKVTDKKAVKKELSTKDYILAIFDSPTNGLKVVALCDFDDTSRFNDVYHYLGDSLNLKGRSDLKFDDHCCNISRPCFWSVSKDMYLNRDANLLKLDLAEVPQYKAPSSGTPLLSNLAQSDEYSNSITPLKDYKGIREKIKSTHTLFERYYNMNPGNRNNNLFILSSFFYTEGIPEDYAVNYLVAYYSDQAAGFSAIEIERTVKSAYR